MFASKKRRKFESSTIGEHIDHDDRKPERRRRRLRSGYIEATPPRINNEWDTASKDCPPSTGYELDRLNYHIELQNFGKGLQDAANTAFSSDRRSRYTDISALLLSWFS